MTTEQTLLVAILTDPKDDLPRLVYADWLDENRQTERAEFIRVQCELAKGRQCGWAGGGVWECVEWNRRRGDGISRAYCKGCERHEFNLKREQELWTPPPEGWFPLPNDVWISLPKYTGQLLHAVAYVRRGFVSEIRCTMADWCGGGNRACTRCGFVAEHPWEDRCPSCNSHRLLKPPHGIGREVMAAHPVERVVLTDREPSEAFWWWRDGDGTYAANPSYIPSAVFNCFDKPYIIGVNGCHYDTRQLAIDALSAACILWAKSQPVAALE